MRSDVRRIFILIVCAFAYLQTYAYGWSDIYAMRYGVKVAGGASYISRIKDKSGVGNPSDMSFNSISLKPMAAWEVGGILQFVYYDNVFSQTELVYRQNGVNFGSNYVMDNSRVNNGKSFQLNGLKATTNFGKKFALSDRNCLLLGIGFYVSLEMSTEDKFKFRNSSSENEAISDRLTASLVDVGPTGLLAVENDNMQIGLNLGYGLVPVLENYKGAKNMELKMSVAYFF